MSEEKKQFYQFGPFRVDPARQLLLRGNEPVPMTAKAFETLLVLVRRSQETVSKDELMKVLWPDTFVEEANLTQHISMLRKALGESPQDHRYILTVPGRGYRFAATVKTIPQDASELGVQTGSRQRVTGDENESGRHSAAAGSLFSAPAKPERIIGGTLEEDREQRYQHTSEIRAAPARPWWRRKAAAISAAALVIALAALSAIWYWVPRGAPRPMSGNRVMLAVLPFDNLGPKLGEEYLSDGLTEETITQLGELSPDHLGVIARTSAMRYRKTQESVDQIGRELHVDYILEGSVRHEADRVRVTAQLIRVNDQTHVWAASYDRDLSGVLFLQGEIAQAIAQAIEIKFSPEQKTRLASVHSVNAEAHEAYLRGRYLWSTHTEDGLNRSIEYFKQAIAIDPNYAQAYAGLAASYGVLGVSYLPPQEVFPKARAADTKALEIDPKLAYGYAGLGAYKLFYEQDLPGAETALKRALDLGPNDAEAHELYASYLEAIGQLPQAVKEMQKAHELDPLALNANADLGNAYYYMHEFDQAIEQYRKTLEISPESGVYQHLGLAYVQKHRYGEAIAAMEKGLTLSGRSTAAMARLGYALGMAGKRKEALQELDRINQLKKTKYAFPEDIALVYVGLGDKDHAFEWLDKAVSEHSWAILLNIDPSYESLRDDPRFDQLIRRIVQSRKPGETGEGRDVF